MKLRVISAIDESIKNGARQSKACQAIELCERRLRRWRKSPEDLRKGGYRAKSQKLTDLERLAIVKHFGSEELKDLPIRVAHAKLMDRGIYLGSPASCIRVMKAIAPKLVSKTKNIPKPPKPQLKATGPNQVWSWDVTWLPSMVKGKYFYLYMILDMFSRFIIDWEVHTTEDSVLARQLFTSALDGYEIPPDHTLTIHADNGQMMRSQVLSELFHKLSVNASHSRPHTSNDNAFSESVFSVLKGRLLYPEKFLTIDSARYFTEEFVGWYNFEHKHSELAYLSPFEVHENLHLPILKGRNELLENYRKMNPSRCGGKSKIYQIPEMVELKHKVTLKKVA